MYHSLIVFSVLSFLSHINAKGYGPGGILGGLGGSGGMSDFPGVGENLGAFQMGVTGGPAGVGRTQGGPGVASGILGRPGLASGTLARPGISVPGMGSSLGYVDMSPKPYSTSFNVPDGQGGSQFRSEQGDGSGTVRGTYGYTDAQGLYRVVNYVANQYGFTADVKTNEPGVDGKENPADVTVNAEKPPAGIQEQYTRPAVLGGGRGVWGGYFGSGVSGGRGTYPGFAAGFPGAAGVPGSVGGVPQLSSLPGMPGSVGGIAGAAIGFPSSTVTFGGGSGLFTEIPVSSSRKSIHQRF